MPLNILVLCTGNSCRSQMAEAYLKLFTAGKCHIYSAGIESHGLNPFAIKVMAEDGIDISDQSSNKLEEYHAIPFDYVITVCDHARESCPWLKASIQNLHHSFRDPAQETGSLEKKLHAFKMVRDEIKEYCRHFANKIALVD